ncbi:MAG: hypothetical protein HC888_19165 [Candidatus Competibacteraceae bacterium]|nr:hypothetical protein [Candidatus Competibacteraceae bacterium]
MRGKPRLYASIMLAFLTASVLPVLLLYAAVSWVVYWDSRAAIENRVHGTATNLGREIEGRLAGPIGQLRFILALVQRSGLEAARPAMDVLGDPNSSLESCFVSDLRGTVLGAAGAVADELVDISGEPYFQRAIHRAPQLALSSTFIAPRTGHPSVVIALSAVLTSPLEVSTWRNSENPSFPSPREPDWWPR